ncbi:MAG: UvrD-helicase domain-containing protein [Defluviitaleaceae bacterium]|nr:UvrD-helicase domain-containing protein [Defluviitaleaceae bacterium]
MRFTQAQQAAIKCDASSILVSAAAGSGKTAVLTERILRHISNNIGIDRLLVVTFTEAAAAEMKERITDKIQALQLESPSQHLADQEALLATADISTIHAFCRKLVKEHFQMLDIDPAFKVADDSELAIIKSEVMDEVFEEAYNRGDPAFLDLVDVYGGKAKDDGLDTLVRRLYAFLESDPFPLAAAKRYADKFSPSPEMAVQQTLDDFLPTPIVGAATCRPQQDPNHNQDQLNLDNTPWAALAKEELQAGLDGIIEGLRLAIGVCHLPGGPERYIEKMEENEAQIQSLKRETAQKTFSDMYQAFLQMDWGRLPSIKESDMVNAALKDRAQRIRNKEAKDRFKDLVNGVFFAPPMKMQGDLSALTPRVEALMALVTCYAEAFAAEKLRRNLLDFSDLEHFAIKVLYPNGPKDMTPGPVAATLSAKYHEVLIDEYQDSNKVQDLILSGLAKQRFMVGDVKQSIYRFRRANPGLFVEKYNNFTPADLQALSPKENKNYEDMQSYIADSISEFENISKEPSADSDLYQPINFGDSDLRVDLSQNFRSRAGVIDAVNFFFAQLMCPDVGEVKYDNAAALHTGADYPPLPEDAFPGMWVEILDQSGDAPEIEPPLSEFEEEEPIPAIVAETRMIAACIHELIATPRQIWDKDRYRPCRLGDIVILARSANSIASGVVEELKRCGIDAIADTAAAFYQQKEIKTALAFLRITDNPRQDHDLITAMHSPAYGFTPDELFQIKQCPVEDTNTEPETDKKRRSDFYDHLIAYALRRGGNLPPAPQKAPHNQSHTTEEKTHRFLSHLEKWRNAAPYLPISRLIGMIYEDTSYPSCAAAMEGGEIRQANLRMLLDKAIEFEETSFKGLFHFIHYIEGLYNTDSAQRVSGATAPADDLTNRVRLMSIHKSKGLEFPIVITGFLGKPFNMDDERKPIILHGSEGLGPKYVNLEKRTRSKTLAHYALARLTRKENLSEELRCLYVAMTRAKELLILTGRTTNLERDMEKWADAASVPKSQPSVYYRQGAGRYLDWIMPCLLRHNDGNALLDADIDVHHNKEIQDHPAGFDIRVHRSLVNFDAPAIEKPPPSQGETTPPRPMIPPQPLPSKLSISEIKRLYASDISPDSTPHQDPPPTFDPPGFLQAKEGITAMSLGSAMHTVAEHIDFHNHITSSAISQLITQLKEKNLLTQEIGAAIDHKKILALATSPIADRIRAASKVHRETPFVMAIPAPEVYPEIDQSLVKETILVHGIIDCYFEEGDGLVLIDFKSESPGPDPAAWASTHRTQIEIYKKAIKEATGKYVKEAFLYSFAAGAAIAV